MAQEFEVKVQGLKELTQSLTAAQKMIPAAIRHALSQSANTIRDEARSNVDSSSYNLSHHRWDIGARMSKASPFMSLVGYYPQTGGNSERWSKLPEWFNGLQLFEKSSKGGKRVTRIGGFNRGKLKGQRFLQRVIPNVEPVTQEKMEESISQALRDLGL